VADEPRATPEARPPSTVPACLAHGDANARDNALRCWVEHLAGPELRGRDNGTDGGKQAQDGLVAAFQHLGLRPAGDDGYLQPLPRGANVLGMLEGTDPKRAQEVVVLGAHYDHLGQLGSQVYYGADDNASGVAVLVEVARALANPGARPPRSVLFIAFDAEEPPDYLTRHMGSQWFVDHPALPRERIVAMLCMDLMGGDLWEGYSSPLFVMGLETFAAPEPPDLATLAEPGSSLGLRRLHLRAVEDVPGGRQAFSDYGPFWDAQIPVLFLSTGRSPHYHQPTDLPATLRYPKLLAAVPAVEKLVRWVAGTPERPRWAVDQRLDRGSLDTVIELLRTALHSPPAPEVGALGALAVGQDLARLEAVRRQLGGERELDESTAPTLVRASLRLQCLLAPDEEVAPAACLLL
jgi:hypothetical protein